MKTDVTHGTTTGYRRGCRCRPCTDAQVEYGQQWRIARRARGLEARYAKREIRTCQLCGKDFETRAGSPTRFCSVSCSKTKVRSRELVHVGPRVVIAPPVPVTVVSAPKWWAVIVQGPCAWCGESFTATGSTTRYCSRRCSRSAAKRRQGRFLIPPRIRRAIYERDNWTCQLCFDPIDREAHYLDDWAPSLDHVTPQSHMLIPDHSPSNLRTAHRWCNAVRGDGTWHADFFEEAS